jgi:hypothetical protein
MRRHIDHELENEKKAFVMVKGFLVEHLIHIFPFKAFKTFSKIH